ncbi:MAG: F0F1 ATP synthase subunit B [Candidatus Omnitrophica bacterium]|nr:F0F1 ATP synthase subunit B [Candidatus Omnitrophota bacterium]
MPPILQLDLQQILSQAISFILLVIILRKVAWRPLLAMLDQRRARIEDELRQIAQSKSELAQLQNDYAKRLAKIEDEARTKIQQAMLEGKRLAIELQEQARAQGYEIMTKAKDTVELELAKAKVTLRDQVAAMTMDAVERMLRRKLDATADRQLVDDVLKELEEPRARTSDARSDR